MGFRSADATNARFTRRTRRDSAFLFFFLAAAAFEDLLCDEWAAALCAGGDFFAGVESDVWAARGMASSTKQPPSKKRTKAKNQNLCLTNCYYRGKFAPSKELSLSARIRTKASRK